MACVFPVATVLRWQILQASPAAGSLPPNPCLPASTSSPRREANAGIHHISPEAAAIATASGCPAAEPGVPAVAPASKHQELQQLPAVDVGEGGDGGQQKQAVSDQAGVALQDEDVRAEPQQELEQQTPATGQGERPAQDLSLVLDQAPPLTMQLSSAYQVDPAARVAVKQRLKEYAATVARLQSRGQVITHTNLGLRASAVLLWEANSRQALLPATCLVNCLLHIEPMLLVSCLLPSGCRA